jgi:hypothetical protein
MESKQGLNRASFLRILGFYTTSSSSSDGPGQDLEDPKLTDPYALSVLFVLDKVTDISETNGQLVEKHVRTSDKIYDPLSCPHHFYLQVYGWITVYVRRHLSSNTPTHRTDVTGVSYGNTGVSCDTFLGRIPKPGPIGRTPDSNDFVEGKIDNGMYCFVRRNRKTYWRHWYNAIFSLCSGWVNVPHVGRPCLEMPQILKASPISVVVPAVIRWSMPPAPFSIRYHSDCML